jgi:hypothetical protein
MRRRQARRHQLSRSSARRAKHAPSTAKDAFAEEVEKWRLEIRIATSEGDGPFAPDAELYYIEVGLRNYPNQAIREGLLAIPTAYTLNEKQVEELTIRARNFGREYRIQKAANGSHTRRALAGERSVI